MQSVITANCFLLCLLYKPACLQKHFRGRVLSILEFSSDRLALFKQYNVFVEELSPDS